MLNRNNEVHTNIRHTYELTNTCTTKRMNITLCNNCFLTEKLYTLDNLNIILCKVCRNRNKKKLTTKTKRSFCYTILFLVFVWLNIKYSSNVLYGILICMGKVHQYWVYSCISKGLIFYLTNGTNLQYLVIMFLIFRRLKKEKHVYSVKKVETKEIKEITDKVAKLAI